MNPDLIAEVAERKILEAIEEGKFDNLPGKGKPLVLDECSLTPSHVRLANQVLKNAGVLPDWLQIRKDVIADQEETASLRARLIRQGERMRARLQSLHANHTAVKQYAEWQAASRALYLYRLKGINSAILKFSLLAPSTARPFLPRRIDEEMVAFDSDVPPLTAPVDPPRVSDPAPESGLKALARARYRAGGGPLGNWARAARLLGRRGTLPVSADIDQEDIRRIDAPRG